MYNNRPNPIAMRTLFTFLRFCGLFFILAQFFSYATVAQSPVLVANYALQTPQNATSGTCETAPNWALQLDGQPDSTRYFTLSSGTLEAYSDGTIHLNATFANYSSTFPSLTAALWFNSPVDWSAWEAAHSPVEYLSFCGTDDNREQWTYANSSGDSYNYLLTPYNGYGWQNTFSLSPLQNDTSIWLQQGVGANGVDGEEGIAFEFGYNGSWQDVNGLDYAFLQGVGRIALVVVTNPTPIYSIPTTTCGDVSITLTDAPNTTVVIATSNGDTLSINTGDTGTTSISYLVDSTTVFRFLNRTSSGGSNALTDSVVTRYYGVSNDVIIQEGDAVLTCEVPIIHLYDPTPVSDHIYYNWTRVSPTGQYLENFGTDSVIAVTAPGIYRRFQGTYGNPYCYGQQDISVVIDSSRWTKYAVVEATIEGGTFYPFAGQNLLEGGNYYDTLQTVFGCDSILRLWLRIHDNSLCQIVSSASAICTSDEVSLDCTYSLTPSDGSFLDFIPDTALWAYYTFDETLLNELGNTNSQFYVSSVNLAYPISNSSLTPALLVSPVSDNGYAGTYTQESLYNYDGFTIAFWYYANQSMDRILWQGFDWTMSLVEGRPAWRYRTSNSFTQIIAPQAIVLSAWNHLAISYNAQNRKYSFYLNGQVIETAFGEPPLLYDYRGFFHYNDGISFEIDNLAIYLTELNTADVRKLFSNEGYLWSTGDTTNFVIVNPENTTTYSCTITDEFNTCTASATIEVVVEDSDEDGVCNARDYCISGPEVGDFCSDGNPCTLIDIVQPDCSCIGVSDPNQAFTLTPSAEKVCGGDSAYFKLTGPPLATVQYSLNGEPASIMLDASGLGVLGISPPQIFNTLTPDTVIIELRSYELPGTELCDTLLSIIDSIIHYGGIEPTIVTKWTNGLDDCADPIFWWAQISYEISIPYLSTLYYSSNYPVYYYPSQQSPYTNLDSVYNFYLSAGDIEYIPQNSDFILTLDSIDFGGCVTQLYDIADTTAIPSQRFSLSDSYGVPIENGVKIAGCDYFYGGYDYLIPLQFYYYGNFAFPAEGEYWWSYPYYVPGSFDGFDFEFEINGTTVHFNNFQYDYNLSWYDVLSDAVTLEGTTYIFSLGSDYDDGPSLYILAGGDYDLINDTVEVRLVAATGPDGCRQTGTAYYLNNGAAVTYIINPIETLPSESITISCADEASKLVGIDVPDDYWGGGGNAWSNQPDFYNTENLFAHFYWNYYPTSDTLLINQPGNYYLFSRDISTCQYYQKEFIVTAIEGTPCDDGNACTINDAYDEQCLCAGTYVDTDGDGACDALEVSGCTDMAACNYSALATESNGSCVFPGCSDATACNYDMTAGCDDGSCTYSGCTDQSACNYNPAAGCEDGTCVFGGCTDAQACNYEPTAVCDDGSCIQGGCSDAEACNYNPNAPCDNGSCEYLLTYPINGNQLPVEYGQSQYSYMPNAGSSYTWSTTGGIIIQPNGLSEVAVGWASPGIGQVCVQETNESGCMGVEICLDVVIQPAISGCTNNEACNYNPLANVDNNSCLFEGEPCNDGIVTTTNDSIAPWCECSGVLSVLELTPEKQFSCFPNPASNSLSIVYYSDEAMQVTLDILDVQGRVCQGGLQRVNVGTNSFKVDIQHLASGCYSIRINSPKVSRSVVFVKE